MPVIQAADIADLISVTLAELGRLRWTNIMSDLQEHIALPQILREERVGFSSGHKIQFNVQKKHSGAAKNVSLFGVDNVNVDDTMDTGSIAWRHSTTNWAIERREIRMNREPARVVELAKTRRVDAMTSLAELMETDFWGLPDSTDSVTPHGIAYWIVYNSSANGFEGQNPTGYSDVADIDASDNANKRWRNYSHNYTSISKTDLIREWREAATKTFFKPPVSNPDYNRGDRYGYYTDYTVVGTVEELLEQQNDALGNDVASMDGRAMFRKTPIIWAPKLDGDPITGVTNGIYGINWGVFQPIFLDGEYLAEDGPRQAPDQHTTFRTHIDLSYNYICRDRRRCFVLSQ